MCTQIRGVLFDLDDTLYDRGAAFDRWLDGYIRDHLQLTESSEVDSLKASISKLDSGGYGSKKAVVEEVCRHYPGHSENTGRDLYEDFFEQLTLDPAADQIMDVLSARSIPFGIVTNGGPRQWNKLAKMGLIERTAGVVVSATFGCAKPEPAIFLAAARKLAVDPTSILFVGDHPINDIIGAQAVGMQTTWLHRGLPWPEQCCSSPDFTIDRLADLLPIVAAMPVN